LVWLPDCSSQLLEIEVKLLFSTARESPETKQKQRVFHPIALPVDDTGLPPSGIPTDMLAATRQVRVCSSLSVAEHALIGAVLGVIDKHLDRGVRYQLLVPDDARLVPRWSTRLQELMLSGASVRTTTKVPMDAVVVDDGFVVLPGMHGGTALFRLPSVVNTTTELFEQLWRTAVPLDNCELPDAAELTSRERQLLTLLSAGSTDEAAASQLNISVRTVRRIVADIMNRLGARSRFQAGVKAADRGWLADLAG
jgi:DNA-binding CsgD family transcriptional regulator